MFIKAEIVDRELTDMFRQVAEHVENPGPMLRILGEGSVTRIKRRFETSLAPDGQRWKPNAESTLLSFIGAKGGIGKRGRVTKKGAAIGASKKPLIGLTHDLQRQNHYDVSGNVLTVANTMIYAAIQHFGGKAGRGHRTVIDARPFFPITATLDLYPSEKEAMLGEVSEYLKTVIR
jgi:phage gpG-like protein